MSNAALYSPQAVVWTDKTQTMKAEREVFEAFRNVMKDVAAITFDELPLRLEDLNEALSAQPVVPPLTLPPLTPDATKEDDGNAVLL